MKDISVILLGEATTGKTSIVKRISKNEFVTNTEATIGASFVCKKIGKYKYSFWDTAGQERYLSLAPMYYRKGEIIILTFDTCKLDTIDRTVYYLNKIRGDLDHRFEVIIVGTKLDLTKHKLKYIDTIVKEKLKSFEDMVKDTDYIYTSSKNATNISELIAKMKEKSSIIVKSRDENDEEDDNDNNTFNLQTNTYGTVVNTISCGYCL